MIREVWKRIVGKKEITYQRFRNLWVRVQSFFCPFVPVAALTKRTCYCLGGVRIFTIDANTAAFFTGDALLETRTVSLQTPNLRCVVVKKKKKITILRASSRFFLIAGFSAVNRSYLLVLQRQPVPRFFSRPLNALGFF